ncbi:hypothetical protein ACFWPQ_16380 [Streptomyces sp. NPDC058464]|uniref:hypothetical protein n=1 Tax=Streptomyces sp. NPDC058464 TaxID=3346511 RepID=UPI0036560850
MSTTGSRGMPGLRAEGLDLAGRRVVTDRGARRSFERLVIATGMTRRTLPGTREPAGDPDAVSALRGAQTSV